MLVESYEKNPVSPTANLKGVSAAEMQSLEDHIHLCVYAMSAYEINPAQNVTDWSHSAVARP